MKKKVLITGAAGFIGSNLAARLLEEGHPVIGIDNLTAGTRENVPPGVDLHVRDIREKNLSGLFEGVDTVFHLAAKNCLYDCLQDPVATSDINIGGTVNILEQARKAGVRKLVYADSSAVYEGVDQFPSRIDRIAPISPYAVSKCAGAFFCRTYQKLLNLNITVLRYFNAYGPVQDWRRTIPPVMSAFIIRLLQGQPPIIYGTGRKRRDFIYIDDVNDFHLLTMNDDRTNGQIYNVGSGTNASVLEILALIEEQLHSVLQPIYRDDLPGEAETTLADITRERALGWSPATDLRAGLDKSIQYLKEQIRTRPVSLKQT